MNSPAPVRRLVSLCVIACAAACGDMEDAVDNMRDNAEVLSDKIDDWLNDPPLKQRHDMCERENGAWAHIVEVGPCKNGLSNVRFVFGEDENAVRDVQQACDSGEGLTYDHQCVHMNEAGEAYFNDGPSTPHLVQALTTALHDDLDQFRWNEIFWDGAVNHDYCYHHGAYRDLTQADCDEQFHIDMYSACAREDLAEDDWFDRGLCEKQADAMFSAVRSGGSDAYNVMSTNVNYPEWIPLWKVYGMDEQPRVGSVVTDSVTQLAAAF